MRTDFQIKQSCRLNHRQMHYKIHLQDQLYSMLSLRSLEFVLCITAVKMLPYHNNQEHYSSVSTFPQDYIELFVVDVY